MAIHDAKHAINDTNNHAPGTVPGAGHNVVGTSNAGAIEEVLVEAPGASTASAVVRRAADNQIQVPSSGQTANEAIGKGQVENLITANNESLFLPQYMSMRDDFCSVDEKGILGWATAAANGGSVGISNTLVDKDHPGLIHTTCAAGDATARAAITLQTDSFVIENMESYIETMFYITHARDLGVEDYRLTFGWADRNTLTYSNAIYFVGTAGLQGRNENNGIMTQTAANPFVKETWYRLGIYIPSDYSTASYYIDGVLVGSISTNLPTGLKKLMPVLGLKRIVVVGVETITAYWDYFTLRYRLNDRI